MKTVQTQINPESTHHSLINHENQTFFQQASSNESPLFFSPAIIQPKLKIGDPDDKYERQADRVADAVVSSPAPDIQQKPLKPGKETLQRMCTECEKEENLQMKAESSQSSRYATPGISQQIQNPGGGGKLPSYINHEMSHKMGADFSNVSIHTGSKAAELNQSLGARAFTHGKDIYFNTGEYNPGTSEGKRLLAHELTHVVQQRGVHHAPVQRSCFDGNCEDCAGGMRDLWVTIFFARRANRETMQHLRAVINGAKAIFRNCCINIKFDFNWTLIPNAASIESASLHRRPAGDASGLFDVPEPMESIGEGQLIAGARGIPMLVVDEIRGTGGATTILGGKDDQGSDFDVEYTGPSMFFVAVNQPNYNASCNDIAHEIWHITGALRHSAAEGGITACSNNNVSETYCNAVRGLA